MCFNLILFIWDWGGAERPPFGEVEQLTTPTSFSCHWYLVLKFSEGNYFSIKNINFNFHVIRTAIYRDVCFSTLTEKLRQEAQLCAKHHGWLYPLPHLPPTSPLSHSLLSIWNTGGLPVTVGNTYHKNACSLRAGDIVHLGHCWILQSLEQCLTQSICLINICWKRNIKSPKKNLCFPFLFFIISFKHVTSVEFLPTNYKTIPNLTP